MECPYQNFECTEVDTSGMDKIECSDCKHYGRGVRPTGATPILGWLIDKITKKPKYDKEIDDLNNFMMGL
jgi:hypothetical protein